MYSYKQGISFCTCRESPFAHAMLFESFYLVNYVLYPQIVAIFSIKLLSYNGS